MSTKIYEAYRCPQDYFFANQKSILKKAQDLAYTRISDAYVPETLNDSHKIFEYVMGVWKKYLTSALSMQRDMADFTLHLTLRFSEGYCYIVPHSDMLMRDLWPEVMAGYAEMEEYSYWNNVDRPDDVTEEAWGIRSAKWDELYKEWDYNYLRCVVIEPEAYCPYKLEEHYRKRYYKKRDK